MAESRIVEEDTSPYMKQEGLKWLKKSAKQGFAPALFLLGGEYMKGKIVSLDKKKGMDLILEAAEKEYIGAVRFIANISIHTAFPYIMKMADKGDPETQGMLGQLYMEEIEVEQDVQKGLELWQKAAE